MHNVKLVRGLLNPYFFQPFLNFEIDPKSEGLNPTFGKVNNTTLSIIPTFGWGGRPGYHSDADRREPGSAAPASAGRRGHAAAVGAPRSRTRK